MSVTSQSLRVLSRRARAGGGGAPGGQKLASLWIGNPFQTRLFFNSCQRLTQVCDVVSERCRGKGVRLEQTSSQSAAGRVSRRQSIGMLCAGRGPDKRLKKGARRHSVRRTHSQVFGARAIVRPIPLISTSRLPVGPPMRPTASPHSDFAAGFACRFGQWRFDTAEARITFLPACRKKRRTASASEGCGRII